MSGPTVYWIRREGGKEPVSGETFTALPEAERFARGLSRHHKIRMEVVRDEGVVIMVVDPNEPSGAWLAPKL